MLPRRCVVTRCSRRPLALGSVEELEQAREFVVRRLPAPEVQQVGNRDIQDSMRQVEEVIQKEAIKAAIHGVGLSLALNAIPGIGNGLAALTGVALGYFSSRYKDRIKKHMKSKSDELVAYLNGRQTELDNAVTAAYRTARVEGFRLAISFQEIHRHEGGDAVMLNPYMNGLGDLGALGITDRFTGRDMWSEARDKINAETARLKKQADDYINPMLAKIKTPGFRALLAQEIAISVRKRPDFAAKLGTANVAVPPARYMTHQTTGSEPIGTTGGYERIPTLGPNEGGFEMPKEANWLPVAGIAAAGVAAVLFLR